MSRKIYAFLSLLFLKKQSCKSGYFIFLQNDLFSRILCNANGTAVLQRKKCAADGFFSILGGEKLCLHARAETSKNMLLVAKLAFNAGRGNLKIIKSLDRIRLIKNRVNRAMHALAILDLDTAVMIDRDFKMIIRADLCIGDIPDAVSKLYL